MEFIILVQYILERKIYIHFFEIESIGYIDYAPAGRSQAANPIVRNISGGKPLLFTSQLKK